MPDPTPERDADQARANLLARLGPRLNEAGRSWLEAQGALSLPELQASLPRTSRTLGKKGLVAAFAERAGAEVDAVWGAVPVGDWSLSGAAQVLLLAEAVEGEEDSYGALFATYDGGGTPIKVACLRALNFVGPGSAERGLELVADAGRTYLSELLGAAWAGNPFSSLFLSDHDYRKAVLKAFFCDVPVEGFLRLEERADAELAQSLCDYVDERLAAGRTIPRAIWPLAALHPRPGLVGRMIGMLEHPDTDERITAARALAKARDARAASFVRERRGRESEPGVQAALDAALESLTQLPQPQESA